MDVFPPAPDSHTFLKVVTRRSPFCVVQRTDVAVDAATITVTLIPQPQTVCGGVLSAAQADVGVVPPGVYDVVFRDNLGSELDRSKLIVRDAGSGVIVSPVGGRISDARAAQIFGVLPGGGTLPTVLFDGIPATNVHFQSGSLVVTPPPHAAGTVDVTVIDGAGSRKSVAAFTYFDPNAEPDPFVFEPLLYPVAYDGPGVFGSQWTTNNFMGTGRTLVRFQKNLDARSCSSTCSQFDWTAVLAPQSQSGLLVWAVRRRLPLGVEDDFHVASRIVDTSQAHGNGTGLPVARENDFRSTFSVDDVPIGGAARALLRIYSPAAAAQSAEVTVTFGDGSSTAKHVVLRPVNGVAFGTVDLSGSLQTRTAPAAVVVRGSSKVWGLVTVTDNVTQEVTAFWPQ